jgi:very-short-patch-repair endonuclease
MEIERTVKPRHAAQLSPRRSGELGPLAVAQHGAVEYRQLLALGFTRHEIRGMVRAGWLHPVHRGVFAVGRRSLPRKGRWMAAVLACQPDALLSHRSAAALHGLLRTTPSALEELTLALCRHAGLPAPAVNADAGASGRTYTVDFLWPQQRVVLETDGHAYHRTRSAIERDRRKEADLVTAGLRVLRSTWRQVERQPDQIGRMLGVALS